jgi:hypothetical protein
MKVAESLDVSLDLGESGAGELVFRNSYIEDALELNVSVCQRLPRVAFFERVSHLLGSVLALDELGNIRRDSEADVTHHTLIVLVPVFLLLGSLVNVILVCDISVSTGDGDRDGGALSC